MANHLISPFTRNVFLLLSYTAATVASSTRPQLSYKTSEQHTPSGYRPQPEDFQNERLYQAYFVIQRFKNTITCDPMNITSTWAGHDICGRNTYAGFHCTALPGHGQNLTITSAVLNGFGLCAPKLQGFIDQLPDLALIQAASNNFGVFDVPSLAGLTYLYKLDIIDDNSAQPLGDAPPGYRQLVDLNFCVDRGCANLGLHSVVSLAESNRQDGVTPGVTDAKALLLSHNNLSGRLPADIGFSKLSYLALANNKLTGPIPPSIAHLQDTVFEVLLLNNQLSGCLPQELGMLTKASVIDAGMNQLSGPIPSSFSCLSSVEQLNLGGNRLYGEVPDALCKLAAGPAGRLANLTLSGNYFTSVGPACPALVKEGVLDVKRNCIPGYANQRGPAECAAFLSQPKGCPAAPASAYVSCPAAAGDARKNVVAPEGKVVARDYSSYVTYATLHE